MNISEILRQQAIAARASHVEIKRAPDPSVARIKEAIRAQQVAANAARNALAIKKATPPAVAAENLDAKYAAYQAKLDALLAAESEKFFNPVTPAEVVPEVVPATAPVNGISVGDELGGTVVLKKSRRKKHVVEEPILPPEQPYIVTEPDLDVAEPAVLVSETPVEQIDEPISE